jgi:dTDP-4-dehydrorhamnose reductase
MSSDMNLNGVLVAPDGMLGRALANELRSGSYVHAAISYPEVDIVDPGSVERAVPEGTTVVFNCAAYTDVDGAEEHEEDALRVNATGVANLAARCRDIGALLVHYSTDYVFDGNSTEPYSVDHQRDPVNAYGRSKAAGERLVEASGANYLLLRTSWLYAPWAKNFVLTMLSLGASRDQLKVVDDQRGRPTSVEHLARTTLALVLRGARGAFHVTDGGECTWHEFATAIVASVNPACRVDPCTSAEFPRPAARPGYSVLELSKTEALLGPMPPWRENLTAVLERVP